MSKSIGPLLLGLLLCSCGPQPKDDSFTAKRPIDEVARGIDTALLRATQPVSAPVKSDSSYGFSVSLTGRAQLHFFDDDDRHTGPATAQEYLPVVEGLLKNPGLEPQERQALEDMRAKITRSGNAGEYALLRQVPNLTYTITGDTKQGRYTGAGEIDVRIEAGDIESLTMTITAWSPGVRRSVRYRFTAGAGQSGDMNVFATMDDFTLSWDSNGDGAFDKEIAPVSTDNGGDGR